MQQVQRLVVDQPGVDPELGVERELQPAPDDLIGELDGVRESVLERAAEVVVVEPHEASTELALERLDLVNRVNRGAQPPRPLVAARCSRHIAERALGVAAAAGIGRRDTGRDAGRLVGAQKVARWPDRLGQVWQDRNAAGARALAVAIPQTRNGAPVPARCQCAHHLDDGDLGLAERDAVDVRHAVGDQLRVVRAERAAGGDHRVRRGDTCAARKPHGVDDMQVVHDAEPDQCRPLLADHVDDRFVGRSASVQVDHAHGEAGVPQVRGHAGEPEVLTHLLIEHAHRGRQAKVLLVGDRDVLVVDARDTRRDLARRQ